ncbi:hypothetical protein M8494_26795 [Serratia ureilytica]
MALALSPVGVVARPSGGCAAEYRPRCGRWNGCRSRLLLALGVTPLAVADVHNYNLWWRERSRRRRWSTSASAPNLTSNCSSSSLRC